MFDVCEAESLTERPNKVAAVLVYVHQQYAAGQVTSTLLSVRCCSVVPKATEEGAQGEKTTPGPTGAGDEEKVAAGGSAQELWSATGCLACP